MGDDVGRFWASATASYVEALPERAGVTQIANEAELTEVLAGYGLTGPVSLNPSEVSAAQAKLALYDAGRLEDVEAIVTTHPVRAVQIWFENANNWQRRHPYVPALDVEMSLEDDAIDALFIAADRS